MMAIIPQNGAYSARSIPAREAMTAARMVSEAFITALTVIAFVWLAWVALWLLEQRWWTLRVSRVIVRSCLGISPAPLRMLALIRR
jgi:hypothetical protein